MRLYVLWQFMSRFDHCTCALGKAIARQKQKQACTNGVSLAVCKFSSFGGKHQKFRFVAQ